MQDQDSYLRDVLTAILEADVPSLLDLADGLAIASCLARLDSTHFTFFEDNTCRSLDLSTLSDL